MKKITSPDSSSLIFALKAPKFLDLLKKYFEEIYITDFVKFEVFESKSSEEPFFASKEILKIKNPKKFLKANLGKGELSSISLAHEHDFVFISEDRKAILFAQSLNVKHSSLLSILLRSVKDGHLNSDQAKNLLFSLVESGFYMSTELLTFMIRKLDDKK